MAMLMSEYHLTPDYILYEMTYPQVVSAYKEAMYLRGAERSRPEEREETEDEIRQKFKKVNGKWQ